MEITTLLMLPMKIIVNGSAVYFEKDTNILKYKGEIFKRLTIYFLKCQYLRVLITNKNNILC